MPTDVPTYISTYLVCTYVYTVFITKYIRICTYVHIACVRTYGMCMYTMYTQYSNNITFTCVHRCNTVHNCMYICISCMQKRIRSSSDTVKAVGTGISIHPFDNTHTQTLALLYPRSDSTVNRCCLFVCLCLVLQNLLGTWRTAHLVEWFFSKYK